MTGDIDASVTAATGGTDTSGPKVIQQICAGFSGGQGANAHGIGYGDNVAPPLKSADSGSNMVPCVVYDARWNGDGVTVPTLTGDHGSRVTDYTALCIGNGQADQLGLHDKVGALNCMHDQQCIVYGLDRAAYNQGRNAQYNFCIDEEKIATMTGTRLGAVCASYVRRLTPLECERLQGFPDGWTDIGDWMDSKGKKHKGDADSPRYKSLGNSICLPFWGWLARRICAQYDRPMTMASLFDGIGGFPLVFSRAGCTPVWASEIEEFPIAVTKVRFPEC